MSNIINDKSLSYTQLTEDILSWLTQLDDYDKWKDFFTGSDGTILVEMLAAQASSEYYKIYATYQENFMSYLSKRISAIAIAQTYGYSAGRGTNIKLTINVTPNTGIFLPALSTIGTCGDYDLILADNATFVNGTSMNVDVYLGNIKSETLTATSSDLLTFRFSNSNISSVVKLYLNDTEVPYSDRLLDLLNDKYVGISNALGGIDIMYLNNKSSFTHKYTYGDELTLKYIEYAEISYTDVTLEFDYGDINSVVSQTNMISQESTKSIQINGPLYAESGRLICAREDFSDVLKTLLPDFLDTSSTDYSNPIVQITYVKENKQTLSTTEQESMLSLLSPRRCFGIPMCYIQAPNFNQLTCNINIALASTASTAFNPTTLLNQVFADYTNKLAAEIDLQQIEHDLEEDSSIKTARCALATTTWSSGSLLQLGSLITPTTSNGFTYYASDFVYKSSSTQPTWPTTLGATVVDNNIEWTCIKLDNNSVPAVWTANTYYNLFDKCTPTTSNTYAYQIKRFINKSSSTEPTWPTTLYDTVNDIGSAYSATNGIIWMAINKVSTASTWVASTTYAAGDIVNSTTTTDFSYQAIGYINRFGTTEPTWPTTTDSIIDSNVKFVKLSSSSNTLTLDWKTYANFTFNVTLGA